MATKINDEIMLSTHEAAKRLGIAVDTVRRYIYRGLLQPSHVGRSVFIAESELQRFSRERRAPGRQPKKF